MQWSHFFHDFKSVMFSSFESQKKIWLQRQRLWHSFFCPVLLFLGWAFSAFFPPCYYLHVLGLPAILLPCFWHIRPANVSCVCYVTSREMNPYHFVIDFCCNFHLPSFQSHSDYFRQKSNRVVICWNVVPILSLRCFFYAFILIEISIVWINTRNCCSLGCHCVWSCRQIVQHFVLVILVLFATHLQSRFYIPIYGLFMVSLFIF